MAQKIQVLLEDDLTGGEADETLRFGFQGTQYEIDLSAANGTALREALAPFIKAARKAGKDARSSYTPTRSASPAGTRGRGGSQDVSHIREWAAKNGLEIANRGRIPSDVQFAFDNRDAAGGPSFLRRAALKYGAPVAPAASALPEITEDDRVKAKGDAKAATEAAIERLIHARANEGKFPRTGGSITSSAVGALIRKGFGEMRGDEPYVNGAGLALLELAEAKIAAKQK